MFTSSVRGTIKNALPSVLAFVEQSELAVPAKSRAGGTSSYSMADLPPHIATGSGQLAALRHDAAMLCAESIRKFSTPSPRKKNGNAKISS